MFVFWSIGVWFYFFCYYISRNVIGVARVECDVDKLIGCRI
ncbi:hypothetical protein ECK4_33090 [Escherichia coli O5:K4(L):H4 str. ATCC 23502]|jgi:hypothetical protein|nr:hypothetical protein HMPREF1596_05119 [Escherichia coli 907700]ESD57746.1 hypothetical protein HMPREF1607_02797 [Escherichia coli 908524]CCQ02428.1 hypothetical protein ECK4_33090 [Escherichia coli O5:K4(L):H4 str. ATCC 23502]